MLSLARLLRPSPPLPTEPCLRTALLETFAHFSGRSPPGLTGNLRTRVVLDDGSGTPWTVGLDAGHFSLSPGRTRGAEAWITGDPLTLVGIVRGKRSGLTAFLHGRITVRGNLSLALKLDGIFDRRDERSNRARPRRVTAAGIDTFYLEAGSGPPVVLLHGLGATNASMLPTLVALSETHRVLAPDLPGFGDSDKPDGDYDPVFFARWLTAFLDRTGASSASLVGNSMGGRIAIETALAAPHRVERLVLLAPSMAFRRFRHAVPLVKLLAPEMGAVPIPLLRAQIEQGVKLLFSRPARIHSHWYEAAADEFVRVFRTPRGRVALFSAARQIYLEKPFGDGGFWPRLERLTRPALFVWGDRDRLVPSGFSRHVQKALPGARQVILRDCGHVPQFEHPETTHALVHDFLAEAAIQEPRRVRESVRC